MLVFSCVWKFLPKSPKSHIKKTEKMVWGQPEGFLWLLWTPSLGTQSCITDLQVEGEGKNSGSSFWKSLWKNPLYHITSHRPECPTLLCWKFTWFDWRSAVISRQSLSASPHSSADAMLLKERTTAGAAPKTERMWGRRLSLHEQRWWQNSQQHSWTQGCQGLRDARPKQCCTITSPRDTEPPRSLLTEEGCIEETRNSTKQRNRRGAASTESPTTGWHFSHLRYFHMERLRRLLWTSASLNLNPTAFRSCRISVLLSKTHHEQEWNSCKAHVVSGRHPRGTPCQLNGNSSPHPGTKQRCPHPHHSLCAAAEPRGNGKGTWSCAEFWSLEHKLCSSSGVVYTVGSAANPDRVITCFFLIGILFVCTVLHLSIYKYLVSGNHAVYDAIHSAHTFWVINPLSWTTFPI